MANLRKSLKRLIKHLLRAQGQNLMEYVLILAMLAFATVAGSGTVSASINGMLTSIANGISNKVT